MEYGNWNNNQYQGRYTGELQNSDYEKATIKKVRKSFSRIGLIYITFLGVSYLSQLAVTLILSQLAMTETINLDIYMLLTMLSMYPLAVPLTGFLMKFVPSTGEIGREQWGIGKISAFFIFSMGVLYIGNLIGTVLMTAVGVLKEEPIANDVQEMILSMEPWLILVVAVIIAPIMEELVFRKFLLDRIAGFGHWTAMTISGVIFGIAHGNFYQFFYAFGLGMIFAYMYLHTGKISYTISFHILINFCGSILPIGLLEILKKHVLLGSCLAISNMMVMFGFVICAVILLICCWKYLSFWPGVINLSAKKKSIAVWGNFGMILFLLCGIGLFSFAL